MSPARTSGRPLGLSPHQPHSQLSPVALQATDFPPLSSVSAAPEKRPPTVAGAWTNTTSTRSILMPSPGHTNAPISGIANQLNGRLHLNNAHVEDQDRGFERPPPKGAAELFNPKVVRRPASNNGKTNMERAVAGGTLAGPMGSMTLEDQGALPIVKEGLALSS